MKIVLRKAKIALINWRNWPIIDEAIFAYLKIVRRKCGRGKMKV